MNYSLSDNQTSMMNFPGLSDNCGPKEHSMPDGSCMAGKEHPGPAAKAAVKAAVKEKAPAKEKVPPKEPKVPKEKKLNLGKAKK